MIQFQENAWTDRRTDRPYFIGPFLLLPGVQKVSNKIESVKYCTMLKCYCNATLSIPKFEVLLKMEFPYFGTSIF